MTVDLGRRGRISILLCALILLAAALPVTALPVLRGYGQAQKPETGCGPGICLRGSFCDSCGCSAPEAPISQVACQCRLIDPGCGRGQCLGNGAYCEGPFCRTPVCYAPTSIISQVLCNGGTLGRDCKLACTPPPSGMRVWWPFDETAGSQAFDLIGSSDGTYQNGPVPAPGKVAYALSFDGVDDSVRAPALTSHNYLNLTVDAWIYPEATSATGLTIVDFGDLYYRLDLVGDELRFSTQPSPTSYAPLSNGANIPLGAWTHVAVVADATAQEIRFYVNGNLVTAFTHYIASSVYLDPSWSWTIGSAAGEYGFFQGAIDEVEIFERPLAQSELQAIYQAGPGGKCKTSVGRPAL